MATRACPECSFEIGHFGQVEGRGSSPTMFSTGTFTPSTNTSLISCSPSSVAIGRTVMPGVFLLMSTNPTPRCFFAAFPSVHTGAKIQSAQCASVVQAPWPLTVECSPTWLAEVFSQARSEPAPGSLKPWHHHSAPLSMPSRKRCLCGSVPKLMRTSPTMMMPHWCGCGAGACWSFRGRLSAARASRRDHHAPLPSRASTKPAGTACRATSPTVPWSACRARPCAGAFCPADHGR